MLNKLNSISKLSFIVFILIELSTHLAHSTPNPLPNNNFYSALSSLEKQDSLKWWTAAQTEFSFLNGQYWSDEMKGKYTRFPERAENVLRKAVWNLSKNSSGLFLRFYSDAQQIIIKYKTSGQAAMMHMPATGVSGLDLYAIDSDGVWHLCSGKYAFGDSVSYQFNGLKANDAYHKKGREYRLFLPLYNTVEDLKIAVPSTAYFEILPLMQEKPIVVYGTSIAQGACASRPGMAWPNILSRKLDRPVINLGFSGNGQLEKEVIDLIKEIEAKIFVLDCLPNMVSTRIDSLELEQRMISAVKNLRFKHPSTPILITHHAGYTEASLIPERKKLYEQANIVADKCYSMLKIEGFQNIFLLKKEEINLGIDDLVDGTHPSDLGMMKYADAYEKIIRTILNEPIGPHKTQIPSRQRREPNSYEWEQRHDEFLKLNKTEKTKIVFLGNSITHNWGGKPHNDRIKGEDSWQKYLDPLAARNFGMGWDRIENVLWRVHHDELDGISPEKIIVNIGTNNLHINSNQEIIEGLKLLIKSIKLKQPAAEIYLIGIYPRRNTEERIKTINQEIQKMCTASEIKYLNIGKVLLQNADNINETLFSDGLHPNHLGYEKLGNELIKHLNR